jgi:hypothetical protein
MDQQKQSTCLREDYELCTCDCTGCGLKRMRNQMFSPLSHYPRLLPALDIVCLHGRKGRSRVSSLSPPISPPCFLSGRSWGTAIIARYPACWRHCMCTAYGACSHRKGHEVPDVSYYYTMAFSKPTLKGNPVSNSVTCAARTNSHSSILRTERGTIYLNDLSFSRSSHSLLALYSGMHFQH